ncbi:MAG TPA: transcription-repair coupling factor [Spirochaetia bacterium]|nr:transcription-repair coupling factor [Spirochaetia bacterium]
MEGKVFPIAVEGTQDGFLSFLSASIHLDRRGNTLAVLPTEQEAEHLYQDLQLFIESRAVRFPWWGCVPYGAVPPLSSVFAERVHVLSRLLQGEELLIVTSLRALLTPLPDPDYLSRKIVSIKRGDHLDVSEIEEKLNSFGYLRVPRVSVMGEFALRGEVLDIFQAGGEEAVRIVFAYDEIEEIRLFNPNTQASTGKREEIILFPMREVVFQELTDKELENGLERGGFSTDSIRNILRVWKDEPEIKGEELYYPLFSRGKPSLLDYAGKESNLFLINSERLEQGSDTIRQEYLELYRRALSEGRLVPRPKDILNDYRPLIGKHPRTVFFPMIKAHEEKSIKRVDLKCDPPRSFFGNIPYLREELSSLMAAGYRVAIFAVYPAQAKRIEAILKDLPIEVLPLGISRGFILPELKIMVVQENEIFGRKRRIPVSVHRVESTPIDTFVDLSPGDYVVHINYGIGFFKGIERMRAAGNERDYIALEYADEERIYIPIEQVNLIQKYIAQDGIRVKLDRLGGKSWENRKIRVRKSVEELAGRLVRLYAKRRETVGIAVPPDTDWQGEFEAGFPYQETEDQLRCIEEVKRDMEQPHPMDRLVCGDVGYGKTEIALRASFKAVMGGRQVALLAPTTILVEQHFETFLERFEHFPVRIGMLSRFRSRKEQKQILQQLGDGQLDVVIGTHRLLQPDVRFKNIGLLIIDEEQRFGVKHKELLKERKTSIDCLALTATPIPRTLHMSLMKIRDMSILNTPPPNRQPIETFVMEFNEEIVARAIRHEVARNGQIYYLHNRVETMPEIHRFLQELLPEISIGVAHGKMDSEELEDIMHRFIHNEFQVLLSTTIIENGLDIPNVNTIIIDRADNFGVAQLYQLKGRVGRSDIPACAYLLYPEKRALTELAMKRLKIISDFTELGSGFKIALKDLEIRGAGNLLGREQSGDILAVGFDMYVRLLDDAIKNLSGNQEEQAPEVYLELEYAGYIPEGYISEPMEKMEVYKKIASITTDGEHDLIYSELVDRFGPLPDEVMSILSLSEIRIICKKLFIPSVIEKNGVVTVEFSRLSHLDVDRVLGLINESGGRVYLNNRKPNCLFLKTGNIGLKEKSEFIKDRLSRLF